MNKHILRITLVVLIMPTCCFAAAKSNQPVAPTAPVPPAIAAAKTVFLSNSCNDSYNTCTNIYNELYAGLQSQARYKLVLDPAQADLIFEIHYSTRLAGVSGSSVSGPISTYGSTLQLIIQDRATRITLWSISESGTRKVTAVDQILADIKTLASSVVESSSIKNSNMSSINTRTRLAQENQ